MGSIKNDPISTIKRLAERIDVVKREAMADGSVVLELVYFVLVQTEPNRDCLCLMRLALVVTCVFYRTEVAVKGNYNFKLKSVNSDAYL